MCVQYRGGAQYRGVFSTVGDIMINVGDILSTVEGVQYRGDIVSTVGVILSTVGDVQYCGDIMMHMGDIMSTVEGVQYHGGKSFVI